MKVDLAEQYRDADIGHEAADLMSPCVQCGQCTFQCPTFRQLNDEWDGPRGRIHLIKLFFEGKEASLDLLPPAYTLKTLKGRNLAENLQLHLDRCLTCRSCETSCPYDVKYGRLLDIAREEVEKAVPRPLIEKAYRRAVRFVISSRSRFATLLRLGQALRGVLPSNLAEMVPEPRKAKPWPNSTHQRFMVIWQGCAQPSLGPNINAAAARVLDRFGVRVVPSNDGCCGSISQHMAEPEEALDHMRRTIDSLWPHIENGAEAIILTASGCGVHFQDYGQLLRDDPAYAEKAERISELARDIAEVVSEKWEKSSVHIFPTPETPKRIAFQSSCSLQHGEGLNGVVEKLLKRAGFKLVPVRYKFMCCGAAGTFSVLQRGLSKSLRESKLQTLLARGPEAIATANIGCMTHLAAQSPVRVNHWIEFLDDVFSESDMVA